MDRRARAFLFSLGGEEMDATEDLMSEVAGESGFLLGGREDTSEVEPAICSS